MAKKRKRSRALTTNKFWAQIGTNPGSVTNANLVNQQQQNNSTDSLVQNMEEVDGTDLTEDNSPANPMAALSSSTLSIVASTSQEKSDKLQAVTPVNTPKIYYMKTYKDMEKEECNPVIQGTASDIKLVIQKETKTATLQTVVQPTKPSLFLVGGKTIQPRITRGPFNTQNASMAPVQKKNALPSTMLPAAPSPAPIKTSKYEPFGPPSLYSHPKGIPKSFLMAATTPGPYANVAGNNATQEVLWVPNTVAPNQNWHSVDPTFASNTIRASGMPISSQTEIQGDNRTYSPSDMYDEQFFTGVSEGTGTGSNDEAESSEAPSGQKRLSAFDRLGPLAEPPKKPKLTINLMCNSEKSVREVVDESEGESSKVKYVPVHLREDILSSTDEIVKKFLPFWPWKKNVILKKSVTVRNSRSVMILEREQMEELYDKDNLFIALTVKGYPASWKKQMVLDALLDELKGKSFIPCFIEFSPTQCRFLVIRSRVSLTAIHKAAFVIRKGDVELNVTISTTDLLLTQLDFIPKLVLRKVLFKLYDGKSLDLSRFTLKEDLSHFIYFPLNYTINQTEITQMQSSIAWHNIVELNLSHNRLTSIDGFRLENFTPKLKHLDLSFNHLHQITSLIRLRKLSLQTIKLEGNPLCHDYIDADYYVKVLKAMFTSLTEIDGMKITFKGDMPQFKKYYCPEDARPIIDTFLEIYFRLLDSTGDNRSGLSELYDEKACLSVTYKYKLRYDPLYRSFRSLFNRSRVLEEGDTDSTIGNVEISKLISKWPPTQHDPMTFTVDVLKHDEYLTIFKVIGIMKLTTESLAEDEHMLSFSRTFVLSSEDGCEYKIANEMLFWDFPTAECSRNAFRLSMVRTVKLSTALESPPDADLKEKLINIFMQITNLNKMASQRCLEMKEWNLKIALSHFMTLLKLDDLDSLYK